MKIVHIKYINKEKLATIEADAFNTRLNFQVRNQPILTSRSVSGRRMGLRVRHPLERIFPSAVHSAFCATIFIQR